MPKTNNTPAYRHSSRSGFSSRTQIAKRSQSNRKNNNADALTTWLDILAKSVVVITALLYIVGRHYTESYYAAMRLPPTNLPIPAQEYLFMSTRSLSFLKTALSASLYSVFLGIFFNVLRTILSSELFKSKESRAEVPSPAKNKKRNVIQILFANESGEPVTVVLWKLVRNNLYYSIPSFIVLSFFLLIPGAEESGRVDAQNALRSAPVGDVLLSQPSIPQLIPTRSPTELSPQNYSYGNVQIIGSLGNQWLFLVSDSSGSSSIMSVPESQIVSIRYSGTPTPTPTPQPTAAISPTSTAIPTGTP